MTDDERAQALTNALRQMLSLHDGKTATRAAWRAALVVSIREYGPGLVSMALRDLADEVERDLLPVVTWQ